MQSKTPKIPFPQELAYAAGILTMALGVALVSASRFGYSMVVAPAYLLSRLLEQYITFGMAEYIFQGLLLIGMCLALRRFRLSYLFSFVTAVLYGTVFDGMLRLTALLPSDALPLRIAYFTLGTLSISISVALFVHTYIAPEVYELLVREVAQAKNTPFGRVKWIYDAVSCLASILLSVTLFGPGAFAGCTPASLGQAILDGTVIEGIGIGTVLAALVNGPLITLCGRWMEARFDFTANPRLYKILH